MNLRAALGSTSSSRRGSPERGATTEATNHPRAPRRAGSFGKGLGSALASSMTRASEAVAGGVNHNKKGSTTPTPGTAAAAGAKEYPFPAPAGKVNSAAASALPATPDPSHLSNFSLKLSELVNQALAPTVAGTQPASTGVASVTKHATGRSSVPKLDQIIYDGKRLPSRAKVQEIAHLLTAELRYAAGVDAYLLRAVSRAALKALTLFSSRIDSLLIPVAKDPSILVMPSTAKEGIHLSPALEYNIGLATITWIVEDALENCIEGDDSPNATEAEAIALPPFVSEILTPVRKKMETTILHVIQPVLTGVKTSITASLLKSVRHPFFCGGSPLLTPSISNESPLPPLSPSHIPASTFASPKSTDAVSGAANWQKELQGRLDGSRKLLVPRIEARTSQDGEGWFISVAVHLIWKGLFVLTTRSVESSGSVGSLRSAQGLSAPAFLAPSNQQAIGDAHKRTPSPGQLSAALRSVASVGAGRSKRGEANLGAVAGPPSAGNATSGWSTPHDGAKTDGTVSPVGVAPLKHAKLGSTAKSAGTQLADLYALQKMSLRFCKGFVTDKAMAAVAAELSRAEADEDQDEEAPEIEDEEDELARQALAEALEALNSCILVVQAMDANLPGVKYALDRTKRCPSGPQAPSSSAVGLQNSPTKDSDRGARVKPLDAAQSRAFKTIPPLLLLHIAYSRLPAAIRSPGDRCDFYLPPPPALFGITWQEYERSIAGFVGGSSWAQAAIPRWQQAVQELWTECLELHRELTTAKQGRIEQALQDAANTESVADELSSTPTPARLAAQAAFARMELKDGPARSEKTSTDISRVSSRAEDASTTSAGSQAAHVDSSRILETDGSEDGASQSSRQDADGLSERSVSSRPTPDASPKITAQSSGPSMDDLTSSTDSLGAAKPLPTAQKGAAPKQRFWKTSGNSTATAGASAAGSTHSRTFHLPSLSRPTFGSRNSSPAGSLRSSLAPRSRSARRTVGSDAAHDALITTASPDATHAAIDAEIAELERTQEAVAFFAKVLEWAGWCAGVHVQCDLCEDTA
ncbi:unnamed protein product [Parajaminaea phylloscopi]